MCAVSMGFENYAPWICALPPRWMEGFRNYATRMRGRGKSVVLLENVELLHIKLVSMRTCIIVAGVRHAGGMFDFEFLHLKG
jgi:hypothetical protein